MSGGIIAAAATVAAAGAGIASSVKGSQQAKKAQQAQANTALPSPINPYEVRDVQRIENAYQQRANKVDSYNPFSYTYNRPNSVGGYNQVTTLRPAQQALLDQQNNMKSRTNNLGVLGQVLARDKLWGNMRDTLSPRYSPQQVGSDASAFAAQGQSARDAILELGRPEMERQQREMASRLAEQGINQGTPAWQTEMDTLNRSRNNANTQAILSGNDLQKQLFDMSVTGATTNNTSNLNARNQAVNEFQGLSNPFSYGATFGEIAPNDTYQPVNMAALFGDRAAQEQGNYALQTGNNNANIASGNNLMNSGFQGLNNAGGGLIDALNRYRQNNPSVGGDGGGGGGTFSLNNYSSALQPKFGSKP